MSNYISDQDAKKLMPNWAVTADPQKKETVTEQVKKAASEFLLKNKGANFMAVTSYFNALNQGKSHIEAQRALNTGYEMGKNLEKLYDWVTDKLRT